MYSWIIVFYVSLIGLVSLILMKRRELTSGKPSFVSLLGKRSDVLLRSISSDVRRIISYFNRQTFTALVQLVAYHILLRVRKIYVELKHRTISNPHGKRLIDAVRGRGEVKYHGASFYLRRIGDK